MLLVCLIDFVCCCLVLKCVVGSCIVCMRPNVVVRVGLLLFVLLLRCTFACGCLHLCAGVRVCYLCSFVIVVLVLLVL